MKAVRAGLVFFCRWLPIVLAAALIAWDLWGKTPIRRHGDQELLALFADDGRLHVLYVAVGADRTIQDVTISPEENAFRIRFSHGLSKGALSGPFMLPPPPLVSPSLGFHSESFITATTGTHFRRLVIPEWILVLGLILLASSGPTLRGMSRRRRKRKGQCTSCGYELHGMSGSCPECGSIAPTVV